MKTYNLPKEYKMIVSVVLLLLTLGCFVPIEYHNYTYETLKIIGIIYFWQLIFRTTHKINILDDKSFEFISLLRKIRIDSSELIGFKEADSFGMKIRSSKGNIYITNFLENYNDFKTTLIAVCPDLIDENKLNWEERYSIIFIIRFFLILIIFIILLFVIVFWNR